MCFHLSDIISHRLT